MKKVEDVEMPDYVQEPIEGTPFKMVKAEDEFFIVMGPWRLSDKYTSYEAAINCMNEWPFMMAVMSAVVQANLIDYEERKEQAKND